MLLLIKYTLLYGIVLMLVGATILYEHLTAV